MASSNRLKQFLKLQSSSAMGTAGIIVSCILVSFLAPTGAYEVAVVAQQVQDKDISSWIFMGLAVVGLVVTVQHIYAIFQLLGLRLLGWQQLPKKVVQPAAEVEHWYIGITQVNTIDVGHARTFEKKLHSCKTCSKLKDVFATIKTIGHCEVCLPAKKGE